MRIQSLPIGESFTRLNLPPHDVSAQAQPVRRSGLADIFIKAGGRESTFPQFSDACALDLGPHKTAKLGANLRFISLAGDPLLLLGVRQIVAVDPTNGTTRAVLTLFRQDSDDHGFYHEEVFGVSDGIVLVYEGGAARISNDGEARWHSSLTWNDVLERAEGDALRFVREEPDGSLRTWSLDLRDGSEHVE